MANNEIAGFRSETISVDGVGLHYWLGGPEGGLPVILLHGFLATGYTWKDVAPQLAQAGCSVLIPDMRGYGDSDKPEGTEGYDARALAEEARSLVKALGFGRYKRIVLAGHDMGALPALLWCADYPEEIGGLLYAEAPVMLGQVLRPILSYTPQSMKQGSMWWWILPFAPGVPERLIVGQERAFLTWFYERSAARPEAITPSTVDEYLRTFSGRDGVLGALGIYRAAFTSIEQTEPLMTKRIATPVIAMGGIKGLGAKVGDMVQLVAEKVTSITLDNSGHFLPEEAPQEVARAILQLVDAAHH